MADIARIKGNIAKMIAQGAPEVDIDAYVSSEGVTADQLRSAPKQEDKYQKTAREEYEANKAKGVPVEAGYARRAIQGATINSADEILAALSTPFEMVKRGTFNPVEGYNYAKAAEDYALDQARKDQGILGTVAEIGGGVLSGSALARGGLTAARALAPSAGIGARSAASAADAAIFGSLAGGMEGNSLGERAGNAALGGAIGGVAGGATPALLAIAKGAASPVLSNIRARIDPQGYARSQVARAATESGRPIAAMADDVSNAAAAGQPFTLADAMGNPGQRMLSTVARAPGEGRTAVVDFLQARQAGQGARLSQQIDEALGATTTARKSADDLIEIARKESSPFYEKALNQKPVWNQRIQQFFDDPITKRGLREGVEVQRLEALAAGKKFDPNDYAITGFNEAGDPIMSGVPNMRTVNIIKKGLDNILEGYRDSTTGRLMLDERGRAIDAVRRSFLKEIDSVNPYYQKARQLFAGPAQVRSAIDVGGAAAVRGRADDNIARFAGMSGPEQQGFRTGYADKLSAGFERGAEGVNKARGLTSEKSQRELAAQSLFQGPSLPGRPDQLSQRIARENTMFETRNHALGGSRTADNFADDGAMAVDPTIVGQVLTGNWGGALKSALAAGSNALSGNTPAVREEVARILLQNGKNVSPRTLQALLDEAIRRIQTVQTIAQQLGRGASAGLAVTPSAANLR